MNDQRLALTYDDIQLVPSYSEVKHRSDISLKTLVSRRYGLLVPLVASPMDTVCEEEMAFSMFLNGGAGCIHRFMSIEEQCKQVSNLRYRIYGDGFGGPFENWGIMLDDWHSEIKMIPIMAAIGVKEEDKKRAKKLVESGANVLLIDVAHGHHINVIEMIKWCKNNLDPDVDVIAGNIATSQAAIDLEAAGADGLRVGIGGGCFTPDMEVKTIDGNKKIKNIEIGDIVYTHTGEEHEVINKLEFDRDEEIMIINDIECTKNHEFYVVHSKYLKIVNDNNIHEYAEWIPADKLNNEYLLIEID
jgi:IMP dehydrogenase/GMP reductase